MPTTPPPHHDDAPETIPTVDPEVHRQIAESTKLRAEADDRAERGIATASDMARALRRMAEHIEKNPQTWDDLFDPKRQR